MLSIFLTEELEREQFKREHDQDTTLLYFFCTNGNENYNNAIAVLRGLAYQLLSKHPDISASVSLYFETPKHTENTLTSPETLWMVFKTLLRALKLGTVYCILDGLDECDGKSIGILVKQFRDFYSPSDHKGPVAQNLKLAIVSRKINGLEDFPQIRLDPDNDNRINEDIKRFISTAMQGLSRRPGYDYNFLRDVEDILLRRSKGTFLWIGFVMKELLEMSTRMEVMDVLNALPQGLPAMYGRMLQQIKSSQRHIISTILVCVTIARRPMTLEELKTAVSLLCNMPINSTPIMRDQIASCGPILQISEGQDTYTCSLVHQSARDYLLREEVDEDPILEQFRIREKDAHTSLARICFACIENSDLRHEPLDITNASVLKKSPLLGYATKHWPEHARHADENVDFSKTFFQKKGVVWKHWWQAYRDALKFYAGADIGPLHIASYLGIDSLVRKMLQANAWRDSLRRRKYVNWRDVNDRTPLMLAAHEGYYSVVQLLLANGADVNVSAKARGWARTALAAAADRGDLSVVQLLLANGADVKLPGNDRALHHAARNGHAAVVQLLLTQGADVNFPTTRPYDLWVDIASLTPLSLAVEGGHETTIRLLLANGADIKKTQDYYGNARTALHTAAIRGQEAIVDLLLTNGADPYIKDEGGRTALHCAITNRQEAIVQLLLTFTKCADVNVQDRPWDLIPLSLAAETGHEATVRLLLANGADVTIKDHHGGTALLVAARNGHEAIVQLLVENGADANINLADFCVTAVYGANIRHGAALQLLHINGADVNIIRHDSWSGFFTPLSRAAWHGEEDLVRLLLAHGANVNIILKDCYDRRYTALRRAVDSGHEGIVRLLLASGADAKLEDEALYEAVESGNGAIVQLLLDNGADSKDDALNWALALAAWDGHEAIVRLLLAKSTQADIKDSMALIRAAGEGHEHILRILLENGADVNARHQLYNGIWYTALETAAEGGHTTTVRILLANGARNVSTNETEEPSRTALDWAVKKGREDIVLLLLTNGVSRADLIKALMLAIRTGNKELVQLLLANDVNHADLIKGLSSAIRRGNEQIVQLLLANGVSRADLIKALWLAMREGHGGVAIRIMKFVGKS